MNRIVRLGAAALLLLLVLTERTDADADLTGLVNSTFLQRTEDPTLHDLAHQRAVEIATDFSHAGIRPGTAEVLAYNGIGAARAVEQWIASPPHFEILANPEYRLIGCGSHVVGEVYFAACVLTWGDSPPPQEPVPAPPAEVPIVTTPSLPPPNDTEPAPAYTPAPILLPNTATEP